MPLRISPSRATKPIACLRKRVLRSCAVAQPEVDKESLPFISAYVVPSWPRLVPQAPRQIPYQVGAAPVLVRLQVVSASVFMAQILM